MIYFQRGARTEPLLSTMPVQIRFAVMNSLRTSRPDRPTSSPDTPNTQTETKAHAVSFVVNHNLLLTDHRFLWCQFRRWSRKIGRHWSLVPGLYETWTRNLRCDNNKFGCVLATQGTALRSKLYKYFHMHLCVCKWRIMKAWNLQNVLEGQSKQLQQREINLSTLSAYMLVLKPLCVLKALSCLICHIAITLVDKVSSPWRSQREEIIFEIDHKATTVKQHLNIRHEKLQSLQKTWCHLKTVRSWK